MKKITVLTVIFVLFLAFFSSCAKKGDPLAYEKGKINAEILILMNGTTLRAEMELMPIEDGKERDASLVFTSPESMSGLSVYRRNGEVSASLGDFKLSVPNSALLYVTELFSTRGTVISAETETVDGESLTKLSVKADGEMYTVWLTYNGLPRKILHENMTVDIVWLESE